jgi:predicted metal-dependent hydrolase
MEKFIEIKNRKIFYKLRSNVASRKITLTIHSDGRFVVSKPRWISNGVVNNFISEKSSWILDQLGKIGKLDNRVDLEKSRNEYLKHKERARSFVHSKLEMINSVYNFKYNRVTIKNQRTMWGSCSGDGNLNFNYKVVFLPENLSEYIIAHEICHLRELNHSKDFWQLLSITIPDYKKRRRELKNYCLHKDLNNKIILKK